MDDTSDLTQSESAYRTLRGEILHGDLMPGDRLRPADLRDRYQLGLTPIREAMMRLATENLVEAESNRGVRVTAASLNDLADIMQTRRAIERLCLEQSIARGDAVWEAEILASMHLLSRTPLPGNSRDRVAAALWEQQHRRFHFLLVSACGSPWMLRFWNILADHSERYRKVRLLNHKAARAEVRDVNAEHRAIMEAVFARDSQRAVELMDDHLLATERSVAQLMAAPPRRPQPALPGR